MLHSITTFGKNKEEIQPGGSKVNMFTTFTEYIHYQVKDIWYFLRFTSGTYLLASWWLALQQSLFDHFCTEIEALMGHKPVIECATQCTVLGG